MPNTNALNLTAANKLIGIVLANTENLSQLLNGKNQQSLC